jgi:uncharacterized protein YndB with AHSA1/START domain
VIDDRLADELERVGVEWRASILLSSQPRAVSSRIRLRGAAFNTPASIAGSNSGLRVGGRYELTMVQRGGGGEFGIGNEIVELVEPEPIVLRSDPMPEVGMHEPTITRVEFHDHGAKTRMTLSDGPYPDGRDHPEAGWTAAFDNLAALVAG